MIFIDNETLVCKDEADRDVREIQGVSGTSKKVGCIGSMERGDVAGGDFFNDISALAGGQVHNLNELGKSQFKHYTATDSEGNVVTRLLSPQGAVVIDENGVYIADTVAGVTAGDQKGIYYMLEV